MALQHSKWNREANESANPCSVIRKKRILIPMIEVGGCHKSIGMALKQALEAQYPEQYHIEVVDLPRACGAVHLDRFIKRLWNAALAWPVITTRVNAWMDELNRVARSNSMVRVFFSDFVRKGMRYIRDFQPDLVLSTHFFCTSVAVFARERYRLDCRVLSHVSDPFLAHTLWVNPQADTLLVCSEQAKMALAAMGQPADHMAVFPFPIASRFFQPVRQTRAELLAAFGFDGSRPIVLASGGGEGIGDTAGKVRELYLSEHAFDLVVVCGRNAKLLRDLQLLSLRPSRTRLVPLGFVDNMEALATLCDVGLIKAGPSTIFELLSKGKPVMLTHVAAKIEQGNLDFVTSQGLGWDVRRPEAFRALLPQLATPGFLSGYHERILQHPYVKSLAGAGPEIARWVVEQMDKPVVPRRWKIRQHAVRNRFTKKTAAAFRR